MRKIIEMSKAELIKLAKNHSATQIKNKYFVNIEALRDIYAKHNIHYCLRFSNSFIIKCYRKFDHGDFETSQYLGMSIVELYSIPAIKAKSNCRFTRANEICKSLGYDDSMDYLAKEGAIKFKKQITPQL